MKKNKLPRKTKKVYEEFLNSIAVTYEQCWIGGKNIFYDERKKYGTYLRKHDPIAFNLGYNEWVRENK